MINEKEEIINKKTIIATTVFLLSYLACCYLVPAFRIKLYAPAPEYFIESIKHMAILKTIISSVVAASVYFVGEMNED